MRSTFVSWKAGTNVVRCLSEEVSLNIGAAEKLVGIEILDARSVLGPGKTPAVMLEGLESADAPLVVQEKPPKEYDAQQ